MGFKCCVKGCKTIAKNGLHSFPSNKLVAYKWIMAIKDLSLLTFLEDATLPRSFQRVCKKHFRESDFQANIDGKSQLVINSVPSLFLPDDADDTVVARKVNRPIANSMTNNNNLISTIPSGGQSKLSNFNVSSVDHSEPEQSVNENTPLNSNEWEDMKAPPESSKGPGFHPKITGRSSMVRKLRYYKNRVRQLREKKINDIQVIDYLSKIFKNTQQLEFVKMQITNCRRPKHGRRYSAEQKSLCLALYKHSPKNYRFMLRWWILPTKSTVGRHSANMLFKTGVDPNVLEAIKNTVKDWPEKDKHCSIQWDEVSLKEHLDYSPSRDLIEGFVELNETRQPAFATHALTFMMRGVNIPFKQSIGYFYTNVLKSIELVELVRLMIGAVSTTGLKPILSVCDQVYTNAKTVSLLINQINPKQVRAGQLLMYEVNGHKIIHCYDPSHIIKTIRNNTQTKNLVHHISKRWRMGDKNDIDSVKVASWDHISALYNMDLRSTQRCLLKLTPEHLAPNKLKMRVSLATQVFSNTCGTLMLRCMEEGKLPKHFDGTAHLLIFINDVFDSLNASRNQENIILKSAVTENSPHFSFWVYALEMLSKMYFVDKLTGQVNNRSSTLKKTESTIRGYMEFAKLCFKLNIEKVSIRDTSQDGIENFFGCVNACSYLNKNTPRQYRTGYATMIINNVTGKNSLNSNCQPDKSKSILTNIHEFILNCKTKSNNCSDEVSNTIAVDEIIMFDPESDENVGFVEGEAISYMDVDDIIVFDPESDEEVGSLQEEAMAQDIDLNDIIVFDPQFGEEQIDFIEGEALSQISSKICQKLMKFTNCQECKNHLELISEIDNTISTTETVFFRNCKNILCGLSDIIAHICYEKPLKQKLISHIQSIETDQIGCLVHSSEMVEKIKDFCVDQTITSFCCNINSFLSGKTKILPDIHNHIQKLAYDHTNKKKKIGKYTDIFNQ